jgi:PAS domain S-box-containing protein
MLPRREEGTPNLINLAGSESVLESLPFAVTVVDAKSRRIVFRNAEARRIIDRTELRYDGIDIMPRMDFRWPDGAPMSEEDYPGYTTIQKGETVKGQVFLVPCVDGSVLRLCSDAVPILAADGSVAGVMIVSREVEAAVGETTTSRLFQTERMLQSSQRRQRFISILGEALRGIEEPTEIVDVSTRLTGGYLQVDRCNYGTVDVDADSLRIFRSYLAGVESHAGEYRLSSFSKEYIDRYRTGKTCAVRDTLTDPLTKDEFETIYRPMNIRALIVVPLIKAGKLVSYFSVNQVAPREWTLEEVALLQEVADRTWSAIERINVQRQLEASEAKYRTLVEGLPQLAWTCRADGYRDYLSPQWVDYTGREEAMGFGSLWLEAVHPEDRSVTSARWEASVRDAMPFSTRFRLRRHDGEYHYFQVQAKPVFDGEGILIKWVGTSSDIHDILAVHEVLEKKSLRQQRLAEAAYKITHARSIQEILQIATTEARQTFDARAVLIRLHDGEGELAHWVGALEDGRLIESTVGAKLDIDRITMSAGEGSQPLEVEFADESFRQKLESLGFGTVLTPGAPHAWVAPLINGEGQRLGTLLVCPGEEKTFGSEESALFVQVAQITIAAISNLRLTSSLEARVADRTARLLQKVEELEGFSFIVSHDLRAPLRSIVGNAKLVLMDEGERISSGGKTMLERLAKAAVTMSQLVDDLLEYARLGAKRPMIESVEVADLAESMVEEVLLDYPSAKITVSIPREVRLECDPRLMGLVLRNLLDNACKYVAPGAAPEVEVGLKSDTFFVKDHGIGLEMKHVGKLFKPFSRLHGSSEYPGTGIGLANVHRILEQHGGQIWVESLIGEGTTFRFSLPVKQKGVSVAVA